MTKLSSRWSVSCLMGDLAHRLGLRHCPGCETLVEYALDGLTESQQQAVRKHLSDCPPCREQVRDFWQVNEGLGLCTEPKDVPKDLCAKVLARLGEDPGLVPQRAPMAGPGMRGWPRFWMLFGPAFAGLSLVMTLVALAALVQQGKAPNRSLKGNALADISNAIMNNPRAAHVALTAAGSAGGDGGVLVLCPGMDHAYFRSGPLAPCPPGGVYALWMIQAGAGPRRLSCFTVERGGGDVYLLQLDGAFRAVRGPAEFVVTQQGLGRGPGPARLKGGISL